MAKRPSLAQSMKSVAQAPARLVPVQAEPVAALPAERPKAATRVGMKRATAILTPADHRRLKLLSLNTGVNLEDLLAEAVADLLTKHGA